MQDNPEARPIGRAGRREWIGLLVLALPCLLYSMDLTVLNQGSVGAALLDVARTSFSQGRHVAAGVNVLIAIGLAFLLAVVLRKSAGATNDVESEDPDRLENMYWDGFLTA